MSDQKYGPSARRFLFFTAERPADFYFAMLARQASRRRADSQYNTRAISECLSRSVTCCPRRNIDVFQMRVQFDSYDLSDRGYVDQISYSQMYLDAHHASRRVNGG